MENALLAAIPLDVVGTGNLSRDANTHYCYVRLSSEITAIDKSPRPDLLWQWKEPLLEALPDWDVTWAPQKRWKDKKTGVHLTSEHHIAEGDQEAVERTCKNAGYKLTGSFFMKPASAGVVYIVYILISAFATKDSGQVASMDQYYVNISHYFSHHLPSPYDLIPSTRIPSLLLAMFFCTIPHMRDARRIPARWKSP